MYALCQMATSSGLSLSCAAGCSRAAKPSPPPKLYRLPPSCAASSDFHNIIFR